MARTHKKRKANSRVFIQLVRLIIRVDLVMFINNVAVRNLIRRIFKYSAIKINAKGVPLYSTLKPETSSDSPSAKSKGARLVSASVVINHILANRERCRIQGNGVCGGDRFIRL